MERERELCMYSARIAHKAGRYHELVGIMQDVVRYNPNLSNEERSFFTSAYKHCIDEQRESIRYIDDLLTGEKENAQRIAKLTVFKQKILQEQSNYCQELLALILDKITPILEDPESKIFWCKFQADIYRYQCEYCDEKTRTELSAKGQELYQIAMNLAKTNYPLPSPIYLKLVLNYTVFLFEISRRKDEAINVALQTFLECTKSENSDEDQFEPELPDTETQILLQMIRDNITFWRNELNKVIL